MMQGPASIFSVAERANCSISTVSNVLNRKGRFSEATRETVLRAVQELGYRTDSAGRNLRLRRTETLGLLFYPSCAQVFRNPFYAEVMEGMEEKLLSVGYHLLLAGYETSTRDSHVPDFLRRGKVDGMILLGAFPSAIVHSFCELNTPLVLLDSNVEWPVDSVVSDGFMAEVNVVDRLVEMGHRRISMLAYNMEDTNIDLRVQGFLAGLKKNNLPAGKTAVMRNFLSHHDIYQALRKRLESAAAPTAVVAVNDTLAVSMMERLAGDGIRIPDRLSIVGYDDHAMSARTSPPLSTVRVDKNKLGQVGAEMILKRIASPGMPITKCKLPVEVIIRESVGRVCENKGSLHRRGERSKTLHHSP